MVSPIGTFFIVLFVLLVVAAIGWVVFTQLRARRLGLPAPPLSSYIPFARPEPSPFADPPQPSSSGGGIGGWFRTKFAALRNRRSAAGAYEGHSLNDNSNSRARGGSSGPLDPDDAWDVRVGNEADVPYYEEAGGGYEPPRSGRGGYGGGVGGANPYSSNAYVGSGYQMNLATADEERGRSLSRGPAVVGGDAGSGGGGLRGAAARNPFDDDDAEPSNISLRGVSPRPIDTGAAGKARGGAHVHGDSPTTAERRSIFRENV
ncbi:hypothetical protein F5B20DRAFT_407519 [Whalleya microplaca]|nr:hypothetical protein F5B20DRAFT_407519 [Whalleya microplaca]